MSLYDTSALATAGVTRTGPQSAAIDLRSNVFEMTQAAEESVLRPREIGAFPHSLRAALAARMARLANDEDLAEHYLIGAGNHTELADPATRKDETALVTDFVDRVTMRARDISAEDVQGLRSSGMADADIVRICELIAFMAYQIRVVAGLRLMGEQR